ncbi:MAG: hypothetical protein ACKOXK_11670 [Chakrabartia sp.]
MTSAPNAMTAAAAQALVDQGLERAAARLGDVTAPIMARFYADFPDALGSFSEHWPDRPGQLEQEMVGNALYFIMTWHVRPAEVKYALWSSVPHHAETLHVPARWYAGMMAAAIDVIAATLPDHAAAEAAIWQAMRADFDALIRSA